MNNTRRSISKLRTCYFKFRGSYWLFREERTMNDIKDKIAKLLALAEVIFDNEDGTKYHLEDETPYTTFYDVKGSYILN